MNTLKVFAVLVLAVVAGSVIGSATPTPAFAQTTPQDLQVIIAKLQAQIAALQAQISSNARQGQRDALRTRPAPAVETNVPVSATSQIGSFDRDLYFRMRADSGVADLQEFLTIRGLYSGPANGNFFILTLEAVKKFQKEQGINPTGYFGPKTRAAANKLLSEITGTICQSEDDCGSTTTDPSISISGISGPTMLKVGESGTWKLGVAYGTNTELSYRVIWGDEVSGMPESSGSASSLYDVQKAVFTHAYQSVGTYQPVFYVRSTRGGEARAGISVVVSSETSGAISVKTSSNLSGAVGQFFQASFEASGGQGSYSFSLGKGDIPPGLALMSPPQPQFACQIDPVSGKQLCPEYKVTTVWLQGTPTTAGTYRIWLEAKDRNGNIGYGEFTVTITDTAVGQLYIEGGSSVGVGQTIELKAFFQPAWSCPDPLGLGITCAAVMPAPQLVEAQWASSNKGIAYVYIGSSDRLTAVVSGVSSGTATIKALYNHPAGGSALTATSKISVVSSVPPIQPITVISPNGGETWTKGTTQTIKWGDNTPIPTCPVGAQCAPQAPKYFDIKLATYYPPCTGTICPAYPYRVPYTIASSVYGSQYSWLVGKIVNTYGAGDTAPDGSYTVQVCRTGESGICDWSDGYFKIAGGGTSTNNPPVINGIPAVLPNIKVGQSVSFSWGATDADGDNLSWGVSWGEGTGVAGACQSPNPQNKQGWTFNASHVWQQAGTYTVKATVSDCRGGSYDYVLNVTVGSTVAPSITVLSPNGGEKFGLGTSQKIKYRYDGPIPSRNVRVFDQKGSGGNIQFTTNLATLVIQQIGEQQIDWTIPPEYPLGSDYKILIDIEKDPTTGQLIYDTSDSPFSIVAATAAIPTLNVSLGASTPTSVTLKPGQTSVKFAQIKATAGSSPVNNLNGIQIGSDSSNAFAFLTNFKVFDGATKIGGSLPDLSWGGGYYQNWVVVGGVSIPANTSKVFTVVADVKPTAPSGSVRLGIAGWNFIAPGANVVPPSMPIYGNSMTIVAATTQPSITVTSPNGGEKLVRGNTHIVTWKNPQSIGPLDIFLVKGGKNLGDIGFAAVVGNIVSTSLVWNIGSQSYMSYSDGNDYKIRISDQNGGIFDESDAPFSIVAAPGTAAGGASLESGNPNLASLLETIQAQVNAIAEAVRALKSQE
ncbi:MAG: peptidoglycan-binding protein [bacterium]|nr:peptidoglycan-binding protein [bacterium]